MPPTPCALCQTSRALIVRPKNGQKLCKTCFLSVFEAEIHDTITAHGLFHPGERVAIGASGGKDSTVLAAVLQTLNERHAYGLDLVLLSIDEGIRGYRDDSLAAVRRHAAQCGLPLHVVGYAALYGWTMDQVVAAVGRRGNCTYCGVFRRQALDRGAAQLGVRHVVTGHNADDVAETVVMNLLRGDLPRLGRATGIVTASPAAGRSHQVKRSKPLKYAYEKEIVLYAHHRGLEYFSTECVYSPEAFRGSARALIKDLERVRPSAILDVVRSGEDMARLVPPEVSSGGGGQGDVNKDRTATVVVADDDDGEGQGGCGSGNGRASGGEMAEMERRLREDEEAQGRETDMTGLGQGHDRSKTTAKREKLLRKKLPKQQLQDCVRCGYLSSQSVCKACVLLEGLNKNRPKTEIEVSVEEEENSPTLARRMEGLNIAPP
ncbi:MAG: hypothetical protein LQ351_001860 [Letrouitia transgressa]|nr:MAG: hypothetical protein LQ351_001860 [Letrouitia transgressa]